MTEETAMTENEAKNIMNLERKQQFIERMKVAKAARRAERLEKQGSDKPTPKSAKTIIQKMQYDDKGTKSTADDVITIQNQAISQVPGPDGIKKIKVFIQKYKTSIKPDGTQKLKKNSIKQGNCTAGLCGEDLFNKMVSILSIIEPPKQEATQLPGIKDAKPRVSSFESVNKLYKQYGYKALEDLFKKRNPHVYSEYKDMDGLHLKIKQNAGTEYWNKTDKKQQADQLMKQANMIQMEQDKQMIKDYSMEELRNLKSKTKSSVYGFEYQKPRTKEGVIEEILRRKYSDPYVKILSFDFVK